MSKRSSERRSYSVDEMMDRLRDGHREKREQEESELVTRPDGSQVVRVRRRKRRSKQPHKVKEVRRRRTGLFALIAGVVLLVALLVTAFLLLARFNSKGYRDDLKARLLTSTGAQVGISDLTVTPFRARAGEIEFQWTGAGVAKSLKLKGLSAALEATSFLGADWNGEVVTIDTGRLLLGPADAQVTSTITEGSLPFDYDSYRCSNLQIIYGQNPEDAAIRITGTEVTMRPQRGGGTQFLMNGGKAKIGTLSELQVGRGLGELNEEGFVITSLRLTPTKEQRGEATLRTLKPIRDDAPAQLEVQLEDYSLAHLLGGKRSGLGQIMGGIVATDPERPGRITADPRYLDSGVLELEFNGTDGTLSGLPFLTHLSGILRNTDYIEPSLGTVSGKIQLDHEGLSLRDFEFETKALMKVQGMVKVKRDGDLEGTFRVGLPHGLFLSDASERYHAIFSEPELGYCWVKIRLFGTEGRPLDDFERILNQGIVPAAAQPDANDLLEDAFRRLTEDPAP